MLIELEVVWCGRTVLSALLPFLSSLIFSMRIYFRISFLIRFFNLDWFATSTFKILLELKLLTSRLLVWASSSTLNLWGRMSKTALFDDRWGGLLSKARLFGDCEKWCKRSTAVPRLDGNFAEASFWRSATTASAAAWYWVAGLLLSARSWLPMVRPSRGRRVIHSTSREKTVVAPILFLCFSFNVFLFSDGGSVLSGWEKISPALVFWWEELPLWWEREWWRAGSRWFLIYPRPRGPHLLLHSELGFFDIYNNRTPTQWVD